MTTGRPSQTALKIARFMLLTDTVPRLRGVLPSGAADTAEAILRASGAVKAKHLDMMRSARTVRFYEAAEAIFGRGQLLWFALRKRWLSEVVERALSEGAKQLLVIGAGFDPLASDVARRHPGVLCVEIDAPATALPKRRGVEGAGLAVPNHVIVPADLATTPLAEALAQTPWRRDVRSVMVAEGLLMYLQPDDVLKLLAQLRDAACAGSRFAFTSMSADDQGRPRIQFRGGLFSRLVQAALRAVGEALRWGIPPSGLPSFLEAQGFRALDQPDETELRRRYLDPIGLREEPLAPYEHVCVAEVTLPADT